MPKIFFLNVILRPIYKSLLEISIHLTWRVLFQNYADQKSFSTNNPKLITKFFYVGSAVDFPIVQQKDFFTSSLTVILVSRLIPDKGIDDFLLVAEALKSTSWRFVLIGPQSLGYDRLYNKVIDYSTRGIILYKGECSTEEIKEEMALSHIFYFPSSYGEGLSRTMLEAGFSLLYPIAYNIASNKDLINEGMGVLLPIGDIGKVLSTLKLLANDRSLLAKNAYSYQKEIIKKYNVQTYSERMDDILAELWR